MSTRKIADIELRDKWLLNKGDIIRGHIHIGFDHPMILFTGAVKVSPCVIDGKDEKGKTIFRAIREKGVDYFAHDAKLLNLVKRLIATKSDDGIKELIELMKLEYRPPTSVIQVPAVNIVAGQAHEILALLDRTLCACILPNTEKH